MRRECLGSSSRSSLPLLLPTAVYLLWVTTLRPARRDGATLWRALPWVWLAGVGVALLALVLFVVTVHFGTPQEGVSTCRRAGRTVTSFPGISNRNPANDATRKAASDRPAAMDGRAGDLRGAGGTFSGRRRGAVRRRLVRDALLGKRIGDIDIATPASPERVIELLEKAGIKVVPTGLAHGTVTAVVPPRHFEITTLRRDVETIRPPRPRCL